MADPTSVDYGYNPLSDQPFERVRSKVNQMRLGGQTVSPAMLSSLYEGELQALESQATQRRSEALTAQQQAQQLQEFTASQAQQASEFGQQMNLNQNELGLQKQSVNNAKH